MHMLYSVCHLLNKLQLAIVHFVSGKKSKMDGV